mgnify:CR=1 FL=1
MKQEPTGAGRRLAGGIPALQGREDVKYLRLHLSFFLLSAPPAEYPVLVCTVQ